VDFTKEFVFEGTHALIEERILKEAH
jgi:hypothetical protein